MTNSKAASYKQLNYIKSLLDERGMSWEQFVESENCEIERFSMREDLSAEQASQAIEWLLENREP